MCGLTGEVRFDDLPASLAAVRRMTGVLKPRGPDAEGFWADGRLAFGHCRLRVIDLSERAAQPMVDPELGLGIVYNGCVYNYQELRAELAERGYRFTSDSDTEVLLKAYHAWGEGFVQRLDGMFAFALWELAGGRVVLGRDRLGIKPLYYAEIAGALRFASSLPALVAAGGVDTDFDPVGLHHALTLQGAVPAPRTLLCGVRKLAPAELLFVEPDGTRTSRTYWELFFGPRDGDHALDDGDWRERTLEVLRRAVHRRLVADVGVGVLLSGGLDSSLVTALAADLGHRPLKTFSIGFPSVAGEEGDEFASSRLVAERFATDHREIPAGDDELLPAIEDGVRALSEPLATPDAFGFYLLGRRVSEHVRVVLSGQGADELFAGYSWYPAVQMAAPAGPWVYAAITFQRNHAEVCQALDPRLVDDDASLAFVRQRFASEHASSDLDHALHFDTTVLLPEDPLKRVDNMTMAWGVEGRVPFVSHEVAELAARMPARLKVAGGGKGVLKEVARGLLPDVVIDRRKAYFPVPPLRHLEGRYLDFVRDVVESRRARERGLFRREYVDELLAEPTFRGRSKKLWQLAVVELWLTAHGL